MKRLVPDLTQIPPKDYRQDVTRLLQVVAKAGYALTDDDARVIWSQCSVSLSAGWQLPEMSDEQVLQILLKHATVIADIAPPEGFGTWLDYAVESFDTRSLALEPMFDNDAGPSQDDMREAARAELRRLRLASISKLRY